VHCLHAIAVPLIRWVLQWHRHGGAWVIWSILVGLPRLFEFTTTQPLYCSLRQLVNTQPCLMLPWKKPRRIDMYSLDFAMRRSYMQFVRNTTLPRSGSCTAPSTIKSRMIHCRGWSWGSIMRRPGVNVISVGLCRSKYSMVQNWVNVWTGDRIYSCQRQIHHRSSSNFVYILLWLL
jgi:hypothetical protein